MTQFRRLLQFLKLALSSHEHDFTRGSLSRGVLLLAVPMVLEPMMESLFMLADAFFVGRLGDTALAVLGLTEGLLVLVFTAGMGLGIPATTMVAQRIGRKDSEGAARAAAQAIWISLLLAVPLGLLGIAFSQEALALMGGDAAVQNAGATYARVTLGSAPIIVLLFVNAAVLRGAGDAASALWALWLANGLNILLDPIFIFGLGFIPPMGVEGAAIATLIGRSCGVLFLLWRLTRASPRLRLRWRHFVVQPELLRELSRLAIGGLGQLVVETSSWVLLTRIVALSGSVAVAGYTVALRVLLFALLPAWGLSGAAATLVGQNLGAGQVPRARRAVVVAGSVNAVFLGSVTILCLLVPEALVGPFTQNPEALRLGAQGVQVVGLGYIFYAWGMVFNQSLNGAGNTRTPFMLNLLSFWCLKLPLAYVLSTHVNATRGTLGVFVAIAFAYSVNAVLAGAAFRRATWRMPEASPS
ncbi:MAG: MATE family efflux transporter [Polyangiaceae bacterium]